MAMFPAPTPASGLMAAVEGVKAGGSLIAGYFQNKEKKMMYAYETKKLKEQTRILEAKINAQLQQALDENSKRFAQEMMRLKTIAESMHQNHALCGELLHYIQECRKMMSDPECQVEHSLLLGMIESAYAQIHLLDERNDGKLKLMQSSTQPALEKPEDAFSEALEGHLYATLKERS